MEAIDGLTDPYAAALWLEQQFNDANGFYSKGRFFVAEGNEYKEMTIGELQILCFDLLKSKGSAAKAQYIIDYLAQKLVAEPDNLHIVPFRNGYVENGSFVTNPKYKIAQKVQEYIPY